MSQSEEAHRPLDDVKAQMTTAYNQVLAMFEEVDMVAMADEISQKQTAALEDFFVEFETKYADAKESALENWNDMAAGLSGEVQQ